MRIAFAFSLEYIFIFLYFLIPVVVMLLPDYISNISELGITVNHSFISKKIIHTTTTKIALSDSFFGNFYAIQY